jgi:recombination protein RecA
MRLGENKPLSAADVFSTGSLGLDWALGIGGWPRGRLIEVFGPESSGKSTLALHAVRECQAANGVAAYIDAEHALDVRYASQLGIAVEDLLVSQPDTGEQALEIADLLSRSGAVNLVVIDSVAALLPRIELEGEVGDTYIGLQARLMSQALRKLVGTIARTATTMLFINQIRHKIGVMFGSPETTPGGNALKFFASVRLDIRRTSGVKDGEQNIGHRIRAKVVKNKMAPPFREAEFEIRYGRGICRETELLDWGVNLGIIDKSGTWYNFGDHSLGQGRERAYLTLQQNPELFHQLQTSIKTHVSKSITTTEQYQLSPPTAIAPLLAAETDPSPNQANTPSYNDDTEPLSTLENNEDTSSIAASDGTKQKRRKKAA